MAVVFRLPKASCIGLTPLHLLKYPEALRRPFNSWGLGAFLLLYSSESAHVATSHLPLLL